VITSTALERPPDMWTYHFSAMRRLAAPWQMRLILQKPPQPFPDDVMVISEKDTNGAL
jgi:hypothetical protein